MMSVATLKWLGVLAGLVLAPTLLFFALRAIARPLMRSRGSVLLNQKITAAGYVLYSCQLLFMLGCVILYHFDAAGLIGGALHTAAGVIVAVALATLGFSLAEARLRRMGYPLTGSAAGISLPPDSSLLQLPGFKPEGFLNGIEILNDDKTPMAFVVAVLEKRAGLDRPSSIRAMLQIHTNGGILLPFESRQAAIRVAESITLESLQNNHQLICRAVGI